MHEIEARLRSRGIIIVPFAMREPTSLKQADKVHLTAEGHKDVAEKLEPKVIDALKGLGG